MAVIQPDIYQPQLPATESQDLLNNLLEQVQYTDGRDDFLNLIRKIESDNNPMASPGTTTAKGVYQFTDKSVETAKNRAINLGLDKGVINLISSDPRQWTDDEADIMFMANMFASVVDPNNPLTNKKETYSGLKGRPGLVDSLLAESYKETPSIDAIKDLYYTIHHTNPNDATIDRTNLIIK